MTRYFKGMIHSITLNHGTEKAFYVEVDDGRWAAGKNNKMFWIPRSVCIIEEANEEGWSEILIPEWVFTKSRIDYHRIPEIHFGIAGKGLIEIR